MSNRQLAIGDFSGNLQIVDLSRPETPIYNAKAHTGIVNSIDGVGGLGVGQGKCGIVYTTMEFIVFYEMLISCTICIVTDDVIHSLLVRNGKKIFLLPIKNSVRHFNNLIL